MLINTDVNHPNESDGTATVLDIDLDFFLDVRPWKSKNQRHSIEDHVPWGEDRLRAFLTRQCGLSTEKKLPGYFIRTHDEAFLIWSELIESGKLITPFNVIHIDSHADLGCGPCGSCILQLCNETMHLPVEERLKHIKSAGMLNEGNFLLLSVALRWLNKIFYVAHPEVFEPPTPDVDYPFLGILIKPKNPSQPQSSLIRILKTDGWSPISIHRPPIIDYEPPTPITLVQPEKLRMTSTPHHVIVCLSPAYTPPETDKLMEVLMEYVEDLSVVRGNKDAYGLL